MTDRVCRHCGADEYGPAHAHGPGDHAFGAIPDAAWQLVATAALYGSEADRLPSGPTNLRQWIRADAKAEAYAHSAEIVSGADAQEVDRWVGYARARLEAVLAESTVGDEA